MKMKRSSWMKYRSKRGRRELESTKWQWMRMVNYIHPTRMSQWFTRKARRHFTRSQSTIQTINHCLKSQGHQTWIWITSSINLTTSILMTCWTQQVLVQKKNSRTPTTIRLKFSATCSSIRTSTPTAISTLLPYSQARRTQVSRADSQSQCHVQIQWSFLLEKSKHLKTKQGHK